MSPIFLKCLLEVKTSTPNCFVYGELGKFPLIIIERKVQKVYRELLNINTANPNCLTWVSGIKSLLESTGFNYIWQQQFVINEREFLNCFKQRLTDIYRQHWWSEVQLTTNNRLFKHIKNDFIFESYLRINNRALRTSLTKIRLSSHIFNIERGRSGPNVKMKGHVIYVM